MQPISDSFITRLNDLVARVEKNAAKYGSRTAIEIELLATPGVHGETLSAAERSAALLEVLRQLQGSTAE